MDAYGPTKEGQLVQFAHDFDQLRAFPDIRLQLTAQQAWCVMAQIQLASRHPDNIGPTRDIAVEIAQAIQDLVAITPALARVACRGWDADYDEEPSTDEGES